MSGRRSTDRRPAATRPNSTMPSVTMNTVTGRWMEASTSFMAILEALEADRLDPRTLLETALPDRHHAVARHQPGDDLGGVARDRAHRDRALHHRIALRDEHV